MLLHLTGMIGRSAHCEQLFNCGLIVVCFRSSVFCSSTALQKAGVNPKFDGLLPHTETNSEFHFLFLFDVVEILSFLESIRLVRSRKHPWYIVLLAFAENGGVCWGVVYYFDG